LNHASLRLVLRDEVRLEQEGKPLKLRRKGLAILAYLAVMGHGSRERLASLLWENGRGRANLRVELHGLLRAVERPLFVAGEDPLRLPDWLEVDLRAGGREQIGGLDDITPAFDDWLESVRSQSQRVGLRNRGVEEVAQRLASGLAPPFLVVVRARPGDGPREFVAALGAALRMPVIGGYEAPGRVLRLVAPPYPERVVSAVLAGRDGGFVLEAPAYGEDPREILQLRNALDPARVRYVELPALSWEDARLGLLRDLPFDLAGRAYLVTAGNPGYLRELSRMGWPNVASGDVPVIPRRIRAAYQLEMRYASLEARMALERLSVNPGSMSEGLIGAFDARGVVDELERRGWLVYDGAWRFREPESRTVLYGSLQPGRRAAYHRDAARQMAVEGNWLGEAYHLLAAGLEPDWSAAHAPRGLNRLAVDAWRTGVVDGDPAPGEYVLRGPALALLEDKREGPGVSGEGSRWRFVRNPGDGASSVTFELPEQPCLLRIVGKACVGSPLGVGIEGDAFPLVLDVPGGGRVVFLEGLRAPVRKCGALLLPCGTDLACGVLLPAGGSVRLACRADAAVVDLEIDASAWQPADGAGALRAPTPMAGRPASGASEPGRSLDLTRAWRRVGQ